MLSQGIPVQEVKIETLRKPLDTLPYVLNNIGLACYAKLGGTPYVLRAEEVVRKELVIGIGRAIDRDTRLAEGKPVIGFTTVFKSNGDFLLSNCTPYCAFEDYQQQLEDVIVSSVERVAEQEGYEEGEEVRIIFHVFKRTGKRENNAVLRGLERLRRYRIEYSLLHVNDTHLFLMFDRTNGQGKEADYVAPRGVAIELGPRERLVNLFGPKQYLGRGFPSPLRLTLDNCSTFRDINYLSQQLFEFSFMSWRGFNPAIGPATLLYSEWIAQLNSKLRKVPNWNQHMLTTLLADKRWFL
jgi:argonaute-like protein implicated in RNA metabolism and viral defense